MSQDKDNNLWKFFVSVITEFWADFANIIKNPDTWKESWKEDRKTRFCILLVSIFAGIALATIFYFILCGIHARLFTSLILLILSLPTLTTLWLFRTHDTREQIQKTQEQIQKAQENVNASLLSNALTMLASEYLPSRCIGLLQLLELDRTIHDNSFQQRIDIATRCIDLSSTTDQQGKIIIAKFHHANFSGANLRGADLREADLRWADLSEADLYGADLREAKYNGDTSFPASYHDYFDPEEAGMIKVED